jgi:hypothetical protein
MYSPVLTLLTVFIVLISCVQGAVAEVVTKCSGAKGQSYYMYNSQPLIAGIKNQPQFKEGDWVEESMLADGVFYLDKMLAGGKEQYDVLYQSNTTGDKKESLAGVGASDFNAFAAKNGNIIVSATNPKDFSLEHYTFKLDSMGNGRVVFSFINTANLFPKASIYIAECVTP